MEKDGKHTPGPWHLTRSEAVRLKDSPFAELGVIRHDGREFTNLGACESEDGKRLVAYVSGPSDNTVCNWDGSVTFGRVVSARTYRGGFGGSRMRAIRVRRPDGSLWFGRYGIDNQLVRLRRSA